MNEFNTLRSNILELLYKGVAESIILNKIVDDAEKYSNGSICSILYLDDQKKCLMHGAAPSLPDFYNEAIHGFPIGLGNGSCGTAAFTGERVIVEDIYTHPYWEDYRSLAKQANVASCWSQPIKDPSGKILGTFAIYHRKPHKPSNSDLKLISKLAELAALVIDRNRIISELEESKNIFKTLANASYEAVCILEGDQIIETNLRAIEMTGFSDHELTQMSIYDFIPEENWERDLNGKSRYHFETTAVKRDGSEINIIINVKNSIFNNRNVSLLSISDITKLKQTETELKILSESVIQSPVSVVVTNFDGNIEYVNPKFIRLTGFNLQDVKGQNPRILSSGNTPLNTYQTLWNTIKSGDEWRGELQNKKKNGELFWEFITISSLKDEQGKITHFIAVKEDISERKRHETIQQIILNISNAVFTHNTLFEFIAYIRTELGRLINTENFFVALYDDKTEMFQLPYIKDEFDSFESFPKKKTISAWVVDNKKVLLANEKQLEKMLQNNEIDLVGVPSKIWLGMPLKGKDKIIGVLVIQSYDDENAVSEKDKEILELVSHQISVSIQNKRFEDDLKRALKQATQSDRLKSSFLATMSHELRTPLNAVLGFSNLIEHDTPIETAVDFSRIINKSGYQLLGIVEDLFDISSIESGDIRIKLSTCTIPDVLSEIEDMIKAEQDLMGKNHLKINLNIPSDTSIYIIETDVKRFKQIYLNLLKNALKFTEQGEIDFGFEKYEINSKDFIKFYVKDTGIGISDEKKESIFELFRQANESSTRKYEGIGIGLSISKKLVQLLGGQIWLDSKQNEGSTFYFTHPYKQ